MSHKHPEDTAPREVFEDPIVQLAALCPFCALAALSPAAAVAALSPVLWRFNPAINPAAALLAFTMPQAGIAARVGAQVQTRIAVLLMKALLRSPVL